MVCEPRPQEFLMVVFSPVGYIHMKQAFQGNRNISEHIKFSEKTLNSYLGIGFNVVDQYLRRTQAKPAQNSDYALKGALSASLVWHCRFCDPANCHRMVVSFLCQICPFCLDAFPSRLKGMLTDLDRTGLLESDLPNTSRLQVKWAEFYNSHVVIKIPAVVMLDRLFEPADAFLGPNGLRTPGPSRLTLSS